MNITPVKIALAAGLTLGAASLGSMQASAAPMLDPGVATASDLASVKPDNVRWVCGPYRCFWRPNYYGGWGWRRPGWGGGWRGGWHRGWRRW